SITDSGTPAAIEITNARGFKCGAIWSHTGVRICGFTDRTTISERRSTSSLCAVAWMPGYLCISSWTRSRRGSLPAICAGSTTFAESSPLISASAMLPAPTKPIDCASFSLMAAEDSTRSVGALRDQLEGRGLDRPDGAQHHPHRGSGLAHPAQHLRLGDP